MNHEKPQVSIITPVYNSQKYLEECIGSVLKQTHTNWEHILVDDCSSDNSADLIKSYQKRDARIKYHRLKKNSGAGVSRNTAIEMAKGRFIAFLDSDDIWKPNKLRVQIGEMLKYGRPFTFTSYDFMDENGEPINKIYSPPPKVTYSSALFKNPIGCLTAVYDSKFFGKVYMPEIRKRQDFALWLKLLKKSDGAGLQQCLSTYRAGNKSISSNKFGLIKYEWKIYREEEGLSVVKSLFYTFSAALIKMKNYLWPH